MKKYIFYSLIMLLFFSIITESYGAKINYIEKNVGVVLGTEVNIRESPGINAKKIALLKEGDFVEIVSWTKKREKIGEYDDEWVKIKLESKEVGYIFGAFLFDLSGLFNKTWKKSTCCGVIMAVKFIGKQNYEVIGGCAEPDCGGTKVVQKGSFSIQGRRILFSGKKAPKEYEVKELFLFRYNRDNVLVDSKVHIDDRSFMKIPHCWGWW